MRGAVIVLGAIAITGCSEPIGIQYATCQMDGMKTFLVGDVTAADDRQYNSYVFTCMHAAGYTYDFTRDICAGLSFGFREDCFYWSVADSINSRFRSWVYFRPTPNDSPEKAGDQ